MNEKRAAGPICWKLLVSSFWYAKRSVSLTEYWDLCLLFIREQERVQIGINFAAWLTRATAVTFCDQAVGRPTKAGLAGKKKIRARVWWCWVPGGLAGGSCHG
ncbi:hypothetical protein RvY_01533 [Ramazzottius varieornatus]|uniref:Uncharacterized protein n=1 Tax=Ramazzottius varieornatus TaxID=947166 RepID=A0A1D1UK47_RAMVA|nr:hypothetical protein RvY_01533 [Ramazzottius varieornatus]